MNIRGIKLLRSLGFKGPRKEIIFKESPELDLDDLYEGATEGATILAFDYSEPINQNPLFEKNVRQYKIKREDFFEVLAKLTTEMLQKGVKEEDLIFLTHQTYSTKSISHSGRAGIYFEKEGQGQFMIDAVESLRKAETDFQPSFAYYCPIINNRIFHSGGRAFKKEIKLPSNILMEIIKDVQKIVGNPFVDFEVYKDNQELFYHDLFLAKM